MNDSGTQSSTRLGSIDAYRGFVMLLMMAEALRCCEVARNLGGSGFWSFLCHHQSHVEWIGCSLHDLIQPSFSFLVGVALPFSVISRRDRGQTFGEMFRHAAIRALALIFLGIFLRSLGRNQPNFTFEDTLTQIGLGYVPLFLMAFRPSREQWGVFAALLFGYWLAFVLYPAPKPDFDYASVGVAKDWPHLMKGFEAHWNKNSNLAWAFDNWFLNLFPREKTFIYNGGGYATLSFIPTLGTMMLGLIAGGILRSPRPQGARMQWLAIAGVVLLTIGAILGAVGVCPIVKRIWTPTWTLFSGGICLILLAAFYGVIDIKRHNAWSFPLMVIGMNSIAAYCIEHLFSGWIRGVLRTFLGPDFFKMFGTNYEPFLRGSAILLVLWLMLLWMHRRRIYLRI